MIRELWHRIPAVVILIPALLVRPWLNDHPYVAQQVYRNGWFAAFREVWDGLTAWVGVPLIVIVLPLFLIWVRRSVIKRRRKQLSGWWAAPNALAALAIWFLVSWGYNYNCPNLSELRVQTHPTLSTEQLQQLAERATDALSALRTSTLPNGSDTTWYAQSFVSDMRPTQQHWLASFGYDVQGEVQVHAVRPAGFLYRMGIGGIYLPFSGQGHGDAGAHPVPQLFTLAHEMAHGHGVTDEGEANTAAFFTLTLSPKKELQYAGWMQLLRYSLGAIRRADHAQFERLLSTLPPSLQNEMETIRNWQRRHPPAFPKMSEAVNDFYLKQQGIEQGVQSYDGFLAQVYSWFIEQP